MVNIWFTCNAPVLKNSLFTLCLSTMGRKKANWFFSWPGRGVKYYIKFLRKKFLHKTIIYHWLSIYYNSVASKFKKKAISFCITLLSIFLDIQNTLNYSIIKACVLNFNQIFILLLNDSPLKLWKMIIFSFSRYSNFCDFYLPFHTFQIQKHKWKWNNLSQDLTCINLKM